MAGFQQDSVGRCLTRGLTIHLVMFDEADAKRLAPMATRSGGKCVVHGFHSVEIGPDGSPIAPPKPAPGAQNPPAAKPPNAPAPAGGGAPPKKE